MFTIKSVKSNCKVKKMPSSDNLILKKHCHCFNLLSDLSGIFISTSNGQI